jgi:hypothetical protein
VATGKTVPIAWTTQAKPYPDQALTCGSKLAFSWNTGMHNLLEAGRGERLLETPKHRGCCCWHPCCCLRAASPSWPLSSVAQVW